MSSLTTTLGLDNDAAAAAVEAMVREAVATCEVIDGVGHTHTTDTPRPTYATHIKHIPS